MIKNYLLITLRSMMKNKFFIFINIFGLAIGIACSIVAYFNWEYDHTFNKNHVNAGEIYRVSPLRKFDGTTELHTVVNIPLASAIRQNMPDVDQVTRLNRSWTNFKVDDNLFPGRVRYVDPEFFNMFSFDFIYGRADVLKDKSTVLISEEMAKTLFGSADVVGRQLTQVVREQLKEFTVGGVFRDQPDNSSFQAQSYMHYDNYFDDANEVTENDWHHNTVLFVQIKDPSRVGVVRQQLQPYRENNNKVREDFQVTEYVLDPFVGMAQRDVQNERWADTLQNSNSPAAVVTPSIMAVLILLIACFNMTNTSIAISSRRLKEIGIRKVMGSMRAQLILQFIGETLFICFLALIIGMLLGEVLLSAWNSLWVEMKLTSHYLDAPGFLIFMIGVLFFTGLLSGSYPAFYISSFEPVGILKGKQKFGGTNYFTRILLCLQYAISLLAIIGSFAFYENSRYQRDFDLGFDQQGVMIVYVSNGQEYETFHHAIVRNKDILAVAGSKHSVFSSRYRDPVKHESREHDVDIIDVGDGYLQAMGLTLLEGRDFQKDSETDRRESVIITEEFAKVFSWDKPLGKTILWHDTVKLYVVGVAKNVYTDGLWDKAQPMMIRYTAPENYTHVIVSAPVEKLIAVNASMEQEWKQIFPNRLYTGRYLNEEMKESLTVNDNIVKMFAFLGLVAMGLSVTGLFTLVSLNIIRKMKEIGVRKVLGASIGNIARIINTEFIIILLIASVAGCLMGAFLVDMLMSSIWKYYLPAGSYTFFISVILMFMLSTLAIGYKVFSAASMNPVSTLRDE
ncbi:ABC transporter permease [Parachryseolinea silvisoli]|uniref:ABC transporter permease n=1 Tax=Parachryseolinea silvisoli TaxID=2873601 RepID=UPI002265974A|nr:ABC transporter permease [Parachryseolinea silvisoli]MCD9014289.1 ABC transporter permease [Parachryseolinea silvisoli]